jgi:peptidoglycan hydrolase CwlO-like protein
MEREDPLEKFERKQAEKKTNGPLKAIMIALAVVAVGLGAALAYVMSTKNDLVSELTKEKEDLTEQIEALQADYEGLSSDYDNINAQLDSSREEIAQLVERVKKTEATNRAKIRQYEKELGTLRSIMRSYIVQIDSLNTLNHKLTAEAASARKEAAEHKKRSEELATEVESLSDKVATGSVIKARGLSIKAYTAADKVTDKASRVTRLLANLTLIENDLAERGPIRIYLCVYDPSGNLITNSTSTSFTFNGQLLSATASREVDYAGNELEVGIYVNEVPAYEPGIYTVRAYTEHAALGLSEMLLR